jgi:site-specific DNA recombinase
MAGIYADEGISETHTKKREQFNKMIDECKSGKIHMIITKSIWRFARNTNYYNPA